MCWTAYIQPEGKLGLASTFSWQPVFKQMFSCRKMHCGSGLGPSTTHSQGCSDNCTGLIKLPEWPHLKALQRPDKNHTAWPRALKEKGKGGKTTFRKCAILSPVQAVEQHLRGLAEREAPPLLWLGLNKESWRGQMCKQMAMGSPGTLQQHRATCPSLLPQQSCCPRTSLCSAYITHRTPKHGKTNQHKAGGTYTANTVFF